MTPASELADRSISTPIRWVDDEVKKSNLTR